MPGAQRGHDQAVYVLSECINEHVVVPQRDRHQADPDLPAGNRAANTGDLSRNRTGIKTWSSAM